MIEVDRGHNNPGRIEDIIIEVDREHNNSGRIEDILIQVGSRT